MVPTASIHGQHSESSTDGAMTQQMTRRRVVDRRGDDAADDTEDDVAMRVGSDQQEPSVPLPPKQLPRSATTGPGQADDQADDPVAPLDRDAFDQMALNHVGEDELPFGITVKTMNR